MNARHYLLEVILPLDFMLGSGTAQVVQRVDPASSSDPAYFVRRNSSLRRSRLPSKSPVDMEN